MSIPMSRGLPTSVLVCLWVLAGSACKRPETALWERPAQRVEIVQAVAGMTPDEEAALLVQVREGLGLSTEQPASPGGSIRIFRLTLNGRPNPYEGRGFGKTWLATTGEGFVIGALVALWPATQFASFETFAIGVGAGGLWGFAYGPAHYRKNQATQADMGYLPWTFSAHWEVLEQSPGVGEHRVARKDATYLDIRPFLHPLPAEKRTEADVRQASLKAYAEALVRHFKQPG